jgi:hypothetical protein
MRFRRVHVAWTGRQRPACHGLVWMSYFIGLGNDLKDERTERTGFAVEIARSVQGQVAPRTESIGTSGKRAKGVQRTKSPRLPGTCESLKAVPWLALPPTIVTP